jgi:hypothetical protein
MQLKHPNLSEALQRVVGKPVLSVGFVEDYVQVRWDGSFFTAYSLPKVLQDGIEYGCESPDYRHAMYRLEGQVLHSAEVILGDKVTFQFPQSVLSVSLRDADYVGPEAIQFGGGDGPLWVI